MSSSNGNFTISPNGKIILDGKQVASQGEINLRNNGVSYGYFRSSSYNNTVAMDFVPEGIKGVTIFSVAAGLGNEHQSLILDPTGSSNGGVQKGLVIVSGSLTASHNISASAFYGDGSNLTNLPGGGGGGIFTTLGSGGAFTTSSIRAGSAGEPSASLYVSGTTSAEGRLFRIDNRLSGTIFYVTGNLEGAGGAVGINTLTPNHTLAISGNVSASSTISASAFYGDAFINEYIYRHGDTNTFIRFEADKINIEAGGENMLYIVQGSGGDQADKVTINNVPGDVDFQVKGTSETNLIRTDAATNRVGIGLASSSALLHVSSSGDEALFRVDGATSGSIFFVTGNLGGTGGAVGIMNDEPNHTLAISGNVSASSTISASAFYGDGSNLTNLPGGGGISWDGSTANGVATYKNASEATVESNLTFDGSTLTVTADGLSTGNAILVDDTSADPATRNTALIIQNHVEAIGATALHVQSDGGITGSSLDKNYTDTAAATVTGQKIDFDKTGTSTSNNTMYGINLDMDNTTALDGFNTMYGIHCTPTLTHAADAGTALVYGAVVTATGGTNGAGIATGARFAATGADLNYGVIIDCEDGGTDLRIQSSVDGGDYFQIQTTTAGASTITTVDDGGAAADLTFNVDGDIHLTPVGNISASCNITASGHVSASAFYGDGQYLKNIGGGGGGGIFTTLGGSGGAYTTSSIRVVSAGEPSASLYVSASAANAGPLLRVDAATAGTIFFVTGSGRVGIGTAAPGQLLEVSGGNVSILSTNPGPGTAHPPDGLLIFDKVFDNSGTASANKIVLYDDYITDGWKGGIGVSHHDIDFFSGENFRFWTAHATNDEGDERFTILEAGNVGIGTAAPDYTLDVAGTVGIDSYIYHNGDDDTYLKFTGNEVNLVAGWEVNDHT